MSKFVNNSFSPKIEYPLHEEAKYFSRLDNFPIHDILIGITYPFQNYSINRFTPNEALLFEYILEGQGKIFLDNKWIDINQGDLLFFNRHSRQNYHSLKNTPFKKIWISVSCNYLAQMIDEYNIQTGIYHTDLKNAFERIFEMSKTASFSHDFGHLLSNNLHNIILSIYYSVHSNGKYSFNLKNFLSNYIYKKISLDEIASELGISKTTLIRSFKKEYGITPYNFLLNEKIEVSKNLLKNTKMSIKEIAYLLCFSDEHYFTFYFSKQNKITPTQYRNK